MIGKRGFIDRQSNVQIVDWRNAPVSQIYYRYEEDDDYEEHIAGRKVDGIVAIRRNVSIAKGNPAPDRRAAGDVPQGLARRLGRGGRQLPRHRCCARRHGARRRGRSSDQPGREGQARRPPRHRGARRQGPPRDRGPDRQGAVRADHAAGQRHRRDPGRRRLGQDHGGAPPRRVPQLPGSPAAPRRRTRCSWCRRQSFVRYVAGVLPALGVSERAGRDLHGLGRARRGSSACPDSPTKYNAEPPDQVSRVKKHPAMLAILDAYVASARPRQQIVEHGAPRRACDASVDGAHRRRDRGVEPDGQARGRAAAVGDGELGEQGRARGRLVHGSPLEGFVKRWKKRADDIVLDWAELLTDPVTLAEGFAGTDVTQRDIERLVAWMKRQLAKAQESRRSRRREAIRSSTPRASRSCRRRGRSRRPVRRRGRPDPAAADPAQARRAQGARRTATR